MSIHPPPTDFTQLDDETLRDPYPLYAGLRAQGPVHRIRTPEGADAWLVVGHEEGRAALADPRLSKNWVNASPSLPLKPVTSGRSLLGSDAPDHTRLRALITREFTARRVAALQPRIEEITGQLLDAMLDGPDRRADLVEALSFPLPIAVICELLGVPGLDQEQFRDWSNAVTSEPDAELRMAAAVATREYLIQLVADKRRQGRLEGTDLLSALIHTSDEDEDSLSGEELLGMAWLLLVAGHETTVNLISNGVLALLTHPEQLAALREDFDGRVDNAVEEMLRWEGPLETPTYRFTLEPVEIGGTVIPGGGELVLVALADANRDPRKFDDPARFDIRRDARGHLAFGHGIHYCIGAPLARLEAKAALRALLDRCPELALDADPLSLKWRPGLLIRGPLTLPVRW